MCPRRFDFAARLDGLSTSLDASREGNIRLVFRMSRGQWTPDQGAGTRDLPPPLCLCVIVACISAKGASAGVLAPLRLYVRFWEPHAKARRGGGIRAKALRALYDAAEMTK